MPKPRIRANDLIGGYEGRPDTTGSTNEIVSLLVGITVV